MSNFEKLTKDPRTGKWETAVWIDDHFAPGVYGVKFPDGSIYNPAQVPLTTRDRNQYDKE